MISGRQRAVCLAILAALAGCSQPPAVPGEPASSAAQTARAQIVPPFLRPVDPVPTARMLACAPPGSTDRVGGPWVTFSGPPYERDVGNVNGPEWSFDAPGLPAISADGQRILASSVDGSLGMPANMTLLVLRAADEKVITSTPLLTFAEFDGAYRSGTDLESIQRAFETLRAAVVERVEKQNATFSREGWISLRSCRIDVDAYDTQPGCSMKEQQIQCGGVTRLAYREPRLDISVRGRKSAIAKPGWVVRPESVPGNEQARYPVRGCVGGAWFDPTRGVAAIHLVHECHGAGDGCYVPGRWQVVQLPAAPGADPEAPEGGECPAGTTAIPAGSFTMGSADGDADERPAHAVKVNAFCLDTREVTVAAYRACVKAGRCFVPKAPASRGTWTPVVADATACNWGAAGRDEHPINCVPKVFAEEYCSFAGKRLPTEEEWEYAARGAEGRKYPWGDGEVIPTLCWNKAKGGTCAVGANGGDRSPFGVMDMAGNVREWTATRYVGYDGCGMQSSFVARGGTWKTDRTADLRGARRSADASEVRSADLGFRCARSR